ncbi:MAG: type III pantothenate kinase [Phycisphaerales bacterium]|nr:type III pantothenate kinase [Phycisphaerales bacterium]
MQPDSLIAVAVNNSRTRVGRFLKGDLIDPASFPCNDPAAAAGAILGALAASPGLPVVLASVNPPARDALASAVRKSGVTPLHAGADVPLPFVHTLRDASTVGQDRILCALGAFVRAEQACIIVDAGTAITVDFVDGEGVFHGGCIAPGLGMMLAALHARTAQLPAVRFEPPDPALGPFGRDTQHAMLLGVLAAARGAVRETIERYAEFYGAFPQIIATGGDAALLFENHDLVEHIVPDLQLIGILEACKLAWGADDSDESLDHEESAVSDDDRDGRDADP